jgi:hypothetical protein
MGLTVGTQPFSKRFRKDFETPFSAGSNCALVEMTLEPGLVFCDSRHLTRFETGQPGQVMPADRQHLGIVQG